MSTDTTFDVSAVQRAAARLVESVHARETRIRFRRRRPVNTDVRAWWGIGACTAVGVAGYGWLMWLGRDVLTYLAGMW